VDLKEGWNQARQEAVDTMKREITNKINADVVRNLNVKTTYSEVKYRHTLFPIWVSSYRYRGKTFNYVVNGQTGRCSGKAPVSIPKVILAVVIAIAIIALGVFVLRELGILENAVYIY
jgi:hypothetical protein